MLKFHRKVPCADKTRQEADHVGIHGAMDAERIHTGTTSTASVVDGIFPR